MGQPATPPSQVRTTRVSALVNEEENAAISARADAAGLSISAYLRLRALDNSPNLTPQALAEVDRLIASMETDLDTAMAALDATLLRLESGVSSP